MPYQREISRDHKACVLFLLDQSFSMTEALGRSQRRKCDELALAVNRWLHNMAIRASGDEGIRDWMDVGVIGIKQIAYIFSHSNFSTLSLLRSF